MSKKDNHHRFEGEFRRVDKLESIDVYGGFITAGPNDYLFEFDDDALGFVCSAEQYERLKEKGKEKDTAHKMAPASKPRSK